MIKKIFYSVLTSLLLIIFWPGIFGFSNYHLNFSFLFAFIPILLVEHQIRFDKGKNKFFRTFFYGFISFGIFNAGTTFWVWNAHWSGALATVTINGGLMSLVLALYGWTARAHSQKIANWAFVSGWLALEVLHESWAFSFPWLDLGHAFASSPLLIQWYEFTGHRGGSFWILISNILLLNFLIDSKTVSTQNLSNNLEFSYINFKKNIKSLRPIMILWLIPFFLSVSIYLSFKSDESKQKLGVIIQPNVDPYTEKFETSDQQLARTWSKILKSKLNDKNLDFKHDSFEAVPDVIVFPETFLHEGMMESHASNFKSLHEFDSLLALYPKTSLIVGAMTYEILNSKTKTSRNISGSKERYYDIYNSAFVMTNKRPVDFYHKSKLVVGVEYMPFGSFIRDYFGEMVLDFGGTTGTLGTQNERDIFSLADTSIKLAPIICWEQDYGDYVREYANKGANVFAIITNDGWWGNTLGHVTHMQYARIRAIENRRWVLRSANTGISGFIDPRGQVFQAMTWGEKGIKMNVFEVNNQKTIFTISGDLIGKAGALLFPFLVLSVFVRKKVF